MRKAFGSAFWAAIVLGLFSFGVVQAAADAPVFTRGGVAATLIVGGVLVIWLVISVVWWIAKFRDWRNSRYVTLIYWR